MTLTINLFKSFLIFDLDGTLVDSSNDLADFWGAWAKRNSLDIAQVVQFSKGKRAIDVINCFLPFAKISKKEIDDLIEIEVLFCDKTKQIYGASSLLSELPVDRWAIVTSAPRVVAYTRLKAANLPLPKVMVSAEDVKKGKPSGEGFVLAAKLMGAQESDCFVFEDSDSGVCAAISAGMNIIQIGNRKNSLVNNSIRDFGFVSCKDRVVKINIQNRSLQNNMDQSIRFS